MRRLHLPKKYRIITKNLLIYNVLHKDVAMYTAYRNQPGRSVKHSMALRIAAGDSSAGEPYACIGEPLAAGTIHRPKASQFKSFEYRLNCFVITTCLPIYFNCEVRMITRYFGWILAAALITGSLSASAQAQQPAENARELSAAMRTIARYDVLGLESDGHKAVMTTPHKFAETQRFAEWTAMHERNKQGLSQGDNPGFVTSFLVSAPFVCASVHDFAQELAPETAGFDTSKPQDNAIYQIPEWNACESIGEYGEIWPNFAVGHNGYVAIYMAARIVIDEKKPVRATLEIPSSTPLIGWINGKRVAESLEKGPLSVPVFGTRYDVTLNPGPNILVVKVAALETRPAFYTILSDAQSQKPLKFTIDNQTPIVSGKLENKLSSQSHPSILQEIIDNENMPVVERALAARNALSKEDADRVVNGLLMNDLEKTASLPVDDLEIALVALDNPAKGMMILEKANPRYHGDARFDLLYARQMLRVTNAMNNNGTRMADEWPEVQKRMGSQPPSDDYKVRYNKIRTITGTKNRQAKTAYLQIHPEQCDSCTDLLSSFTGEMYDRGEMMDYRQAVESLYNRKQNVASRLVDTLDMKLRRAVADHDDTILAATLAEIQKEVEKYFALHPSANNMWNFWLDVVSAYGVDAPEHSPEMLALLQDAGFTADAESWFQRYLSIRVNDSERWMRYAKHCMHRNNLEEATRAYETAARLRPQDDAIASRVDMMHFLSATNTPKDNFEEPYIIKDIPDNHSKDSGGIVFLLDNNVTRILPNGLYSTYTQFVFEVLDEHELQKWRRFDIPYSSIDEKVEILSVKITKKDGSVNQLYTTSDFDTGSEEEKMFYASRVFQIQISDLAVGDRVEYQYKVTQTRREASNMIHFSDSKIFQRNHVNQWFKYTVIAPKSIPIRMMLHHADGSIDFPAVSSTKDDITVTTFEKKDIPRFIGEPKAPGWTELGDQLFITSFDSWDHYVKWHNDLLLPQLKIDDAIRAKVKELTDGVTDPLQKLKNIYYFVVKSTRYVALEFGIHGWKPYPVTKIFERRFGDCKDKASLLKVMLDEAGIPTDFVLIRVYNRGNINMPDLAFPYQFGHAIVYVPQFDLYLDGTAEFSSIYELPDMDRNTWTLITKDDGSYTIRKSPASKPEDNYFTENYYFDLTDKTNISYQFDAEYTGNNAPFYRRHFEVKELQRERLESRLAGKIAGTHINSFEISDLSNYDIPVKISAKATTSLSDIVSGDSNKKLLYPSIQIRHLAKSLTPSTKRRLPLDLWQPYSFTLQYTFVLPSNAKVVLPDDLIENNKFGRIEIRASLEQNKLITNIFFELRQTKISPEEYDEFQAFIQKYDNRLNTQYIVELP